MITSRGRVTTTISQNITFSNVQQINFSSSHSIQGIKQETTIDSLTHTQAAGKTTKAQSQWLYPLNLAYRYIAGTSSATQNASVSQTKSGTGVNEMPSHVSSWLLLDTVRSRDTLTITGSGFAPSNGRSRQQYKALGPREVLREDDRVGERRYYRDAGRAADR